jgi:hypothetical protein
MDIVYDDIDREQLQSTDMKIRIALEATRAEMSRKAQVVISRRNQRASSSSIMMQQLDSVPTKENLEFDYWSALRYTFAILKSEGVCQLCFRLLD